MIPQGLPTAVAQCYKSLGRIASHASRLSSDCPSLLGVEVRTNGLGKLHSLPQITALFASLILPLPAFTAGIKLMGGITLILEVLSRFTGLVLSISMFVDYRTAVPHRHS